MLTGRFHRSLSLVPMIVVALAATPAQGADEPLAPMLEGLGDLHYPITTSSEAAQRFFDQGLRLVYAFNHAEAVRAFEEATRLDPEAAMPHWGKALALGRNLNDSMPHERELQALASLKQGSRPARQRQPASAGPDRRAREPLLRRRSRRPRDPRRRLGRGHRQGGRAVPRRSGALHPPRRGDHEHDALGLLARRRAAARDARSDEAARAGDGRTSPPPRVRTTTTSI